MHLWSLMNVQISCQSCDDREIIVVDEKIKSINSNTMCQNCIVEDAKNLKGVLI